MTATAPMGHAFDGFVARMSQQFLTRGTNLAFNQGFLSAVQVATVMLVRTQGVTVRPDGTLYQEAPATPLAMYRELERECPEPEDPDFLGYVVAQNQIFGFLEGATLHVVPTRVCGGSSSEQPLGSATARSVNPPNAASDVDAPDHITAQPTNVPPSVEVVRKPRMTYRDLIGLEEAKQEMAFALRLILEPGFAAASGLKPSGGILLHGPPGNGKTTFAEATAGSFDIPFLRVHASDLHSKYVGESEKAVRHIFEYARTQVPCILYFDELDTLLPSRDTLGNTQHMASVVNQFLTEMGGMGLERSREPIVLGATNRLEAMDDAAIRSGRFDSKILVPAPTEPERAEILKRFLAAWRLGEKVDVAAWAKLTEGWSIADLESLCQKAARKVLRAGCEPSDLVITNRALTQAASDIKAGLGTSGARTT